MFDTLEITKMGNNLYLIWFKIYAYVAFHETFA